MMRQAHSIYARAAVGRATLEPRLFHTTDSVDEVLAFDTETTTDISQRLRVGAFMWFNVRTMEVRALGLFTSDDDAQLTDAERDAIDVYAARFVRRIGRIAKDQAAISEREKRAASADVLTAFAPVQTWVKANGGIPVMSRAAFADFLIGASQGRLDPEIYGALPSEPVALVTLNSVFDYGAVAAPNDGTAHDGYRSPMPVHAWGRESATTGSGFSFALCGCADRRFIVETAPGGRTRQVRTECPRHPVLMSRKLNGRKNQWGWSDGIESGPLIDAAVLGRALLGPSGSVSLRALGERLFCPILKRKDETGHGKTIDASYLDYLIVDVLASAWVFKRLVERFDMYGFEGGSIGQVYSEASIGKMVLNWFGIPRGLADRPFETFGNGGPVDVDELLSIHQEAYHGGRSEVRARLIKSSVIYCDFKSQYPSINAMMGLQRYLTAERYAVVRGQAAIDRVSKIMTDASHDWLGNIDNWTSLPATLLIECRDCILPVKRHGQKRDPYGMVKVHKASQGLKWFTLADVIASKLLTDGHTPKVKDAVIVIPIGIVETRIRKLFGRDDLALDLKSDDLFTKIIEFRTGIKNKRDTFERGTPDYIWHDNLQESLKLIANATSYGVLAETRMQGVGKSSREVQGAYYAPFVAAHITGGSRLLLAMAQSKARDLGRERLGVEIRHALCDTDSMAFIQPDAISLADFRAVIDDVRSYFMAISPYAGAREDRELFAAEPMKVAEGGKDRLLRDDEPVHMLGVSCKRYALYAIVGGEIKILAMKRHGLGSFTFDEDVWGDTFDAVRFDASDDDMLDPGIGDDVDGEAEPIAKDPKVKGRSWEYQLWMSRIQLAEERRKREPHEPRFGGVPIRPWSSGITRQRMTVATPSYLARYQECGARPGSFFLSIPSRKTDRDALSMIAPYAGSTADILAGPVYHVGSGDRLPASTVRSQVKPMHQALQTYFVNPETKAVGEGEGFDQAPGYLDMPELRIDVVVRLDRKRRLPGQGDLFDTV